MSPRLTRIEQTERNRGLVLAAARRVFLERGYHGATLDHIADEAGFSKGVVYSQFGTKADLFLALLDLRIDERALQNVDFAADLAGAAGVAAMFEHSNQVEGSEPEWTRLVIEFRVHAARDPELSRRYAVAHERTLDGIASTISGILERAGDESPLPPRYLAEVLAALRAGLVLEQAAIPGALTGPPMSELVARLLTMPAAVGSEPR
jgi:AcrR family transcriptional regulator